jgi:prevent-host-death family protein
MTMVIILGADMKAKHHRKSSQTTIPAGEFKTHCLKLMDDIAERGGEIVITKHGKPVAKLVPVVDEVPDSWGFMRGTAIIHGDIVSADHDAWELSDD